MWFSLLFWKSLFDEKIENHTSSSMTYASVDLWICSNDCFDPKKMKLNKNEIDNLCAFNLITHGFVEKYINILLY